MSGIEQCYTEDLGHGPHKPYSPEKNLFNLVNNATSTITDASLASASCPSFEMNKIS